MAVDGDKVRGITGSTLDNTAIQPFIDASACFMEQISDCTESMTTACVENAQAYLASHLLTSSTVGQASAAIKQESLAGKYSVTYLAASATGQGVLSTPYGQAANAMVRGCLAQLDKNPTNILSIGSI